MNPEIPEVWRRANEITSGIEKWLTHYDGKPIHPHFKKPDLIRLLRLRTWMLRYRITIEELLDLLIPILRIRVRKYKKGYGLGVTIQALVGEGSETILREELEILYPDHLQVWRHQTQEAQLEAERRAEADGMAVREKTVKSILDYNSVESYLANYKLSVLNKRSATLKESTRSSRRRKQYRGNPWL